MPTKLLPPPIQDFDKLIEPHLEGAKLISYDSEYFIAPGDNFGSTIFKAVAHIQNRNETNSDLPLIVKLLPSNEMMLQIFEPERCFRTEQCCYTTVAPALIKLQQDVNIPNEEITNVFAKCYGVRTSLDPDAIKIDSGAALVLENLTPKGYRVIDRLEGCDFKTTEIILRDLARFHATVIAFKIKHPVEFAKKFQPYFKPFDFEQNFSEDLRDSMNKDDLAIMKSLPGIGEKLYQKIEKTFQKKLDYADILDERPDGPFMTIAHSDFWTNNFLILYDENGKPQNLKMVDFQAAQLNSCMHDLIFFIFVNVQIDIVKSKLDVLFKEYYEQFINWLKRLDCSVGSYSYELFQDEINKVAPIQFHHIISMLRYTLTKKGARPNLDEVDDKTALNRNFLDDRYFDRIKDVIEIFEKKGFLN